VRNAIIIPEAAEAEMLIACCLVESQAGVLARVWSRVELRHEYGHFINSIFVICKL
jgi:hypothetical protein